MEKQYISHGYKIEYIKSNVQVLEAHQLQVASTVTNTKTRRPLNISLTYTKMFRFDPNDMMVSTPNNSN